MAIDFAKISCETERLILRPLTYYDFNAFYHGLKDRNGPMNAFDSDMTADNIDEVLYQDTVDYLNDLAKKDISYVLTIFSKSTGEALGKVEYTTLLRDDYQWGTLGYIINNQHWNNGYATEAVIGSFEVAKHILNYHRIEACVHPDNAASIKVLQNAGMKYETTREKFVYENEVWTDHHVYSTLLE